jgi:hypothetical protein
VKITLSFGLLTLIFIFGVLFPSIERGEHSRTPAAFEDDGSCFSLVKNFLIKPQSEVSKIFSKLTGLGRQSKFDFDKFLKLKARYESQLSTSAVADIEFERTPEGLLAFAEALNKKNHFELGPNLSELSYRKSRALEKVTKPLLSDKALRVEDLEASVSEIYSIILGPTFRLRDAIGESGKRKIMHRIFAEDVTRDGLVSVLEKYKVFKEPGKIQKLKAFFDTKKGKYLLTGIFNLGTIWGVPPLYLPGLKRIKIPHDLAKEAMLKGMNDELMNRMIKAVNEDLVSQGGLKLETQAKYRIFRKYYMYGVSAFTVYYMYSDFRMAEQYREENRIYEDALEDVAETVSDLENLEERGFNLFEEPENEVAASVLSNTFCRAIEDCLVSEQEESGIRPEPGSESFKACKEFMDPENKCDKY